ncbi:hypothetical protein GJAV_G00108170 [Gymnothorax javanicus]|nr:hypothetical protein GJAV_G00108170 [Gymnothorax javanicus]
MKDDRICSPPFTVLNGEYGPDTMSQIEKHGISFPFVCKTRVAHGTDSHEMALIFSEEDLKDIKPPCVVQSFINHNAVLYKVFVVGESYTVVERPSLRNFPSGPADRDAIFFNSHNVSKPECSSALTSRDNAEGVSRLPCDDVIRSLSKALRQALGVSLFGIDIIISNQTGQHAVIDINAFPGYEGVPEFFNDLLSHISGILQNQALDSTPSGQHRDSLAPVNGERDCCRILGKDLARMAEAEVARTTQGSRRGCNTAASPNFQSHCRSPIAAQASSQ